MKANRKFVKGNEAVSAVIGVILMVAITVAIAATVYVYVSGMLTNPGANAPNLAWTTDDSANTLTFTSGSATDYYNTGPWASPTSKNLVFRLSGTTDYYVTGSLYVQTTSTAYSVVSIGAGNVLHFNATGTYQIVWVPTNKLLGSVTFT